MPRKLMVCFSVMMALSFTGLPAAAAVFIWTVAIPYMEQFSQ